MQPSYFGLQPAIVVLKEGTDTSQGKGQLLTNIRACTSLADILQTTLGPRGCDKMIIKNQTATVSNDGATILSLLDVTHPAARCLVDISKSQDSEIGDGTTSVCVLAGSLLRCAAPLVEDGVHPRLIARAYRHALKLCIGRIYAVQRDFSVENDRSILLNLAATAMNSKLIAPCREQFSTMVVDAVLALRTKDEMLNMDNLSIKQVLGGALQDSQLVRGIAFKKTFSYAGHEQYQKKFDNPLVLLLNFELEWAAESNSEIRLDDPQKYTEVVAAEYEIIYNKLRAIKQSNATVVFSTKAIGDLATQYFADNQIFGAGRVPEDDMRRMATQMHCPIISAVSDIGPDALGKCGLFEEKQVGSDRFNFLTGFDGDLLVSTIILRGGAEQFIAESERSLHDSIMVVRRAVKQPAVIAGAGSIEMQLSYLLYRKARELSGKEQACFERFAEALEVIPKALADNAGLDSTDILNRLRNAHAKAIRADSVCWDGVDIRNDYATLDAFKEFIWEPANIRINALRSAVEACCIVLLVDQTFNLPSSTQNIQQEKNKTADLKKKLDAAGIAPSVTSTGKPSTALYKKMGAAARRLK